jgi:hypothetical protein
VTPVNLATYRWPVRVGDRARVIGSEAVGTVVVLGYQHGRPSRALIQTADRGAMVSAAPEQVEVVHG